MRCEDWQELILDREQLEAVMQKELGQHLASCEGCHQWALALMEVDSTLTASLQAELGPSTLRSRIKRAVRRERRWVKGMPEVLDALGWSTLAILVMGGLFLGSNARGEHLWVAGAGALVLSLACAGRVLWKDQKN
jgi:predicted anti-sigma-YlaC factor YlaD